MSILDNLYHYKFLVEKVTDGDTIVGRLDKGRNNFDFDVRLRLLDIQAPEIQKARTKEERDRGWASKVYLSSLILNKEVVVKTHKANDDDDFGRMLTDVYLVDGTHVNKLMIDEGYAVVYVPR